MLKKSDFEQNIKSHVEEIVCDSIFQEQGDRDLMLRSHLSHSSNKQLLSYFRKNGGPDEEWYNVWRVWLLRKDWENIELLQEMIGEKMAQKILRYLLIEEKDIGNIKRFYAIMQKNRWLIDWSNKTVSSILDDPEMINWVWSDVFSSDIVQFANWVKSGFRSLQNVILSLTNSANSVKKNASLLFSILDKVSKKERERYINDIYGILIHFDNLVGLEFLVENEYFATFGLKEFILKAVDENALNIFLFLSGVKGFKEAFSSEEVLEKSLYWLSMRDFWYLSKVNEKYNNLHKIKDELGGILAHRIDLRRWTKDCMNEVVKLGWVEEFENAFQGRDVWEVLSQKCSREIISETRSVYENAVLQKTTIFSKTPGEKKRL